MTISEALFLYEFLVALIKFNYTYKFMGKSKVTKCLNWEVYFFGLLLIYWLVILKLFQGPKTGIVFNIVTSPKGTVTMPHFWSANKNCYLSVHYYLRVFCKYKG